MADILLVEDNAEVRSLLIQLLTCQGHQVAPTDSGKAALKMAQSRRFDLMITDIVMAMSGGGYQSCADYLKMARQLGADLTLAKPFTREQLKGALETLLGM